MGNAGLSIGVRAPDGLSQREQGEWRDTAAAKPTGSSMAPFSESQVREADPHPFFFGDFPLAGFKSKVQPGGGTMTGGGGGEVENARAPHSHALPLGTPLSVQGGRKSLRSSRKS